MKDNTLPGRHNSRFRSNLLIVVVMASGAWSYGGDSNTPGAQPGASTTHYIGKIEEAANAPCTTVFSVAGANAAGFSNTYGYDFLHGTGSRRGDAAYGWGVSQAQAAYNCWWGITPGGFANYVGALTLFGDIEACDVGGCRNGASDWFYASSADHSVGSVWQANVNIVSGFVNTINQLMYNGGIYLSPSFGSLLFNNWGWATHWFPLWFVGSGCGATTEGSASHAPGFYWENQLVNLHNANLAGNCQVLGQEAIVWQYVSGAQDYDLTAIMNYGVCVNKSSTGGLYCANVMPATY
jgi:hypothetical protein